MKEETEKRDEKLYQGFKATAKELKAALGNSMSK